MWKRDKGADASWEGRMVAKKEEMVSKASHSSPAFASSLGFNLDTEKVTRFHMDGAGFGHSVVQYGGSW